jgi:putative transposase
MSSHVNLIIGSTGEKMEHILRDMKRHTSKSILKAIEENTQESRRDWMLWMFKRAGHNSNNETYQFWQQNNHPIELFSNEVMQQKLDYIHNNPIEAEAHEYLYSSAIDYSGEKGLIDIMYIE